MKIEQGTLGKQTKFRELAAGDCFTVDGEIFITTDEGSGTNLDDGTITGFSYEDVVTPLPAAKVVIS